MLDFAEKNDLEIVGDSFGESIADTPAFLYEGREMFYKLQILGGCRFSNVFWWSCREDRLVGSS